jgi:hypothetical protein
MDSLRQVMNCSWPLLCFDPGRLMVSATVCLKAESAPDGSLMPPGVALGLSARYFSAKFFSSAWRARRKSALTSRTEARL